MNDPYASFVKEPLPTLFSTSSDSKAVRPLTVEESKVYMAFAMAEQEVPPVLLNAQGLWDTFEGMEAETPFALKVLTKRLQVAESSLMYSRLAVSFLAYCSKTPGEAVMWAYSLIKETRKGGPITMARLGGQLIPWGLPTEKRLQEIWSMQKIPFDERPKPGFVDNWLDTKEAYQP